MCDGYEKAGPVVPKGILLYKVYKMNQAEVALVLQQPRCTVQSVCTRLCTVTHIF